MQTKCWRLSRTHCLGELLLQGRHLLLQCCPGVAGGRRRKCCQLLLQPLHRRNICLCVRCHCIAAGEGASKVCVEFVWSLPAHCVVSLTNLLHHPVFWAGSLPLQATWQQSAGLHRPAAAVLWADQSAAACCVNAKGQDKGAR